MRIISKSIKVIGEEALKLVKAGYDSGMSWATVAKQMAIRYLLEEQRANIYAQANADLFDKLTAKTLEHNTTVLDLATKLQNETIRAEQLEDKLQISNDNLAQLQKKADAIGIGKPTFPQDQLRPGDPRRDFPGGVPHTINSSAARTAATGYRPAVTMSAELPSNSLCHYDSPVLSFPNRRTGPTTTAVFDEHPGHRAAQGQAGRRTEPTLDADWPGTIAD